jgi:hypothetical protein
MPVQRRRILELALESLMGEKNRIDVEIAELRSQLREENSATKRTERAKVQSRPVKKASPSQSQKRKQNSKAASSMKKMWEKARKAGFSNLRDYKASLSKK